MTKLDLISEQWAESLRRRLARRSVAGAGGCRLWVGSLGTEGYGQIHVGGRVDGWLERAHRAAYRVHVGPIGDLCVCHQCDVRNCVEPTHLFLGTRADNNADKIAKGRDVPLPGHRNGRAKLSEADVLTILARYARGDGLSELGAAYAITPTAVGHIVTGRNWKHIRRDQCPTDSTR